MNVWTDTGALVGVERRMPPSPVSPIHLTARRPPMMPKNDPTTGSIKASPRNDSTRLYVAVRLMCSIAGL